MKRKKKQPRRRSLLTEDVHFRAETELVEHYAELAEREGRSLGETFRRALRQNKETPLLIRGNKRGRVA